jgi:ABC-type oligopeptide transport system substrate-binding subunit
LTDLRHAIVVRASAGALNGTGPFAIERLESARLLLRANDRHWAGRPFVDGIRVDMDRPRAAQLTDLEAGRADIVSATPLDARRLTQRGLHIAASRSIETVALVFEPHRSSDALASWRRTLSVAVNRASLCAVLLQGLAEPADAPLPPWLSGYAPLFALDRKAILSKAAIAASPLEQREVSIRVDASDPLAQAIAERVAVDGREAGFAIMVQAPGLAPRPDARVIRIEIPIASPDRALAAVAERFAARDTNATTLLSPGASLDAVYQAEQKLLDRAVVIPLAHLPQLYGLGDRVGTWNAAAVHPSGQWNFADIWLRGTRP